MASKSSTFRQTNSEGQLVINITRTAHIHRVLDTMLPGENTISVAYETNLKDKDDRYLMMIGYKKNFNVQHTRIITYTPEKQKYHNPESPEYNIMINRFKDKI